MNSEISILKKEDVGGFYPVFVQALKTVFPCYSQKTADFFVNKVYTPANFIYWLNNNLKTILVSKEKDELTGFMVIDQPYGGVSFCRWLAVLPKHQKKGLGKKLIEAWIVFARSQGCHKIELASQPLAKTFYEKVGLTLEGEKKLSYFGVNQFIFGKVIGKPDQATMVQYF